MLARVFGTFITWMQERTSPVYVVATANDVSQLPPELMRKGRFDEIFWVDLPTPKERTDIFRIHIDRFGRDPASFDIKTLVDVTEGFTGSEIEEAVKDGLFEAFDDRTDLQTPHILRSISTTVPLSKTMANRIKEIREWAKGRTRPASVVEAPKKSRDQRHRFDSLPVRNGPPKMN